MNDSACSMTVKTCDRFRSSALLLAPCTTSTMLFQAMPQKRTSTSTIEILKNTSHTCAEWFDWA
jgi:hypothetical protein